VGIGNPLRGDDGAGPALVKEIQSSWNPEEKDRIILIDAGEAPENYLMKIANLSPETILLLDTADFRAEPGKWRLIDSRKIQESGISTHNASLKLTVDFLEQQTRAKVFVLGIQPLRTGLGEEISDPVKKAIQEIAGEITGGRHA